MDLIEFDDDVYDVEVELDPNDPEWFTDPDDVYDRSRETW